MKLNIFKSVLAAGLLLVGAASCTEEVKYDEAAAFEGNEVYFKLEDMGDIDLETDATEVIINLYRVDTSSELTVNLESTVTTPDGESAAEIFGVPANITFAQGEAVAPLSVAVNFPLITSEVRYDLKLKIAGESQTPYGATEGSYVLVYGTKYEPWAEYLEGEDGWFQMAGAWTYYYNAPVYFRQSTNMPNLSQFKIAGPFSDLVWDYELTVHKDILVEIEGVEDPCYFVSMKTLHLINDIDGNFVDLFGDGSTYLILSDAYNFWVQYDPTLTTEQIFQLCARNEIQLPYYRPATGEFYINILAQTNDAYASLSYSPAYGGIQHLQLPGFKTYGVYIYDGGVSVDATGLEQKMIDIYKTEDTPAFKYQLLHGNVADADIETAQDELAADGDVEAVTESNITVQYELSGGEYTMIAVGLDETGAIVSRAAEHFTYAPAADGFTTIGYAPYTDGFLTAYDANLTSGTWNVEVQESNETPGIYRIKNAYRTWAEANEIEGVAVKGNFYLTIDATDKTCVFIEESNIGLRFDFEEGYLIAYSRAAQMLAEGSSKAAIKLRKMNGKMSQDKITFPANSLLVGVQNMLPEYTVANVEGGFALDLSQLEPVGGQAILGRVVNKAEHRSALSISRNAEVITINR